MKRNHRGRSISLDRSLVRSGIKRAHAVVVVVAFVAASRRFAPVPVGLCRREKRAKVNIASVSSAFLKILFMYTRI
jgi:hypothetical protein